MNKVMRIGCKAKRTVAARETRGRSWGLTGGGMRPVVRRTCFRAGFTFAEVLAAMVFLAVLIPVVIQGILLANRAATVSARQALAARLGANQLEAWVATGQWQSGLRSGTFAPDYPMFQWQLSDQPWSADSMTELTLEVRFEVQGRPYTVRLSTLVDTSGSTDTGAGRTTATASPANL